MLIFTTIFIMEGAMDKKEDRRITMTKRMLKEALIEMLKDKDIYHISIRELCDKADVNRTTFYKYYGSQFDLLSDMENDLLLFISKILENNDGDTVRVIAAACEYLEDNLEFARLIINNNIDPLFAEKLFAIDAIKESSRHHFYAGKSDSENEYIYNFLTYGVFRMVCMWLNKEERESPREFAELVGQIVLNR